MGSVEANAEVVESFAAAADPHAAVVMINLLRYREAASYPAGFEAEPCSGRSAYQRYGNVVAPMIAEAGGRVLWAGRVEGTLIAPDGEQWDDAILVEYPSAAAFEKMVTSDAYLAVALHRTAALIESRLIATNTLMMAQG